jgi:hypothetical protein
LAKHQVNQNGSKPAGQPPEAALVPFGAVAVMGAIVGGALEAAGIKVPIINSLGRQILLGGVGVLFLVLGLFSRWILIPLWFSARRLEKRYKNLILMTNDLFFAPGGVKDLLAYYRRSGSAKDWDAVRKRAKENQARLAALKMAKDKLTDLALDSKIALVLDHLVDAKRAYLYKRLLDLRRPSHESVHELIEAASQLQDMVNIDVQPTKAALGDLLVEALIRRHALEEKILR